MKKPIEQKLLECNRALDAIKELSGSPTGEGEKFTWGMVARQCIVREINDKPVIQMLSWGLSCDLMQDDEYDTAKGQVKRGMIDAMENILRVLPNRLKEMRTSGIEI